MTERDEITSNLEVPKNSPASDYEQFQSLLFIIFLYCYIQKMLVKTRCYIYVC